MDDVRIKTDLTASERREIELVEEARADVRAGRMVSFEDVKAWAESLGTDHELPPPRHG